MGGEAPTARSDDERLLLQLPAGVTVQISPDATGWTLEVRLVDDVGKAVRRRFGKDGVLTATTFS